MKTAFLKILAFLWFVLPLLAVAQVDSGSNGSDGAFNPTGDVTIDMADHPNGIYQYTSVNIPSGVAVRFTPNVNNSPVVWLVQGDCTITGNIHVEGGAAGFESGGGTGGPGGFRGASGGNSSGSGVGPWGWPSGLQQRGQRFAFHAR